MTTPSTKPKTRRTTDEQPITPVHQWTNGGTEVLILKCVGEDGRTHGGFRWPLEVGATVAAPDARDDQACGGGLHGWPWGTGIGAGKQPDYRAAWIVFSSAPELVREITEDNDPGKVKAIGPCVVRFVGTFHEALWQVIAGRQAWCEHAARGSASNSGARGSASNSGDAGSASNSGYAGSASNSGARGSASNSGDAGSASNSGDAGSASNSGDAGSAETTVPGSAAICTGLASRAKAGPFGCIALAWWNAAEQRNEMRCAETGPAAGDIPAGKLKPDTWYQLDDAGHFVETR